LQFIIESLDIDICDWDTVCEFLYCFGERITPRYHHHGESGFGRMGLGYHLLWSPAFRYCLVASYFLAAPAPAELLDSEDPALLAAV
jgi:hypothetical protein